MKNNNFSEFVGQYEISKTLRFSLIPQWNTEKLLEENKVFKKDKIVNESYHKIKPFLDKLHSIFINESLLNIKLDFSIAYEKFLEIEKESDKTKKKKLRDEFDKIKSELRKNLVKWFKNTWEKWKENYWNKTYLDDKWKEKKYPIKWDSYKILMSETNINILSQVFTEEEYWDEVLVENYKWEKINIFKSFKWFTTYFTNFNHSRENFYKDDWKSGRIATRIIDENMIFFFKNKKNFDEKYRFSIDKENNLNKKLQENIEKHWEKLEDYFELDNYNNCFTWEAISDYYNQIIWWKNTDEKIIVKIQGLNEIINLEKQSEFSKYKEAKKSWDEKIEFKKQNFPIFKELYKQILSEHSEEDKFIEIEKFDDLKINLEKLLEKNNNYKYIAENLIKSLLEDLKQEKDNKKYDFDKIYLSKLSLNTLSAKFFGFWKWELISSFLVKNIWEKNKKTNKLEIPDFVSLENIKIALGLAKIESDENIFKKEFEEITIDDIFIKFMTIFCDEFTKNISEFEENTKNLKENILNLEDFSKQEKEKEEQIEIIKNYLDSSLNIFRMMKYFALEKWRENVENDYKIDDNFYSEFNSFYKDNEIINYYNTFRNYLTQKPYSSDKIKLNFENGTLIDGWDKNKEPDNAGTLLRKNWKYYLALQVHWKKNIFYKKKWSWVIDIEKAYQINNSEENYEKIDYKFLPDPKKMLPKVFFAKWNLELFSPSEEILEIKENETFKIWDKFIKQDFEKIVNYYKECLQKYPAWEVFKFNFSDTKKYDNLSDFYKEVEAWSYNIQFRNVSEKYILENIDAWNIYLFQLYNKDFAEWKIGKENLHTMYFKWLFEENNLKNVVLKLNGQAEIFRRTASIKEITTENRAKNNIENSHKIIKNKRYTEDKLFFHCPIKLNFAKHNERINNKILNYIQWNKEINIIWIDRWEKHLAYFSVINKKGEILKDSNWNLIKWSLNSIEKFDKNWVKLESINYHNKLDKREKERFEARWSWKTIWNIKDLKQWYISQIVHKLAELVIKYNAIIVFEDLNMWFKRWRQKIEKQIYQKLEKALIEKLNYLTFKDKAIWEDGNYLSAYQLTAPFTTFEKMWKQTWIIFYTDPSYTSATCPNCGFRKDLYIKYSNLKNAKISLEKNIDKIYFEDNKFIFEYKNSKNNSRKVFSDRSRKRNISSVESWVRWWETVDNNITDNLIKLLFEFDIDYKSWKNIIEQVIEKNEKSLYSSIFYNFNAILTIRNSTVWDNSRTWDFICCPSCDFDSRENNKIWIQNWDDNWAYNIARKWIILLDKIDKYFKEKWNLDKIKWGDMVVSRDDWDEFCGE